LVENQNNLITKKRKSENKNQSKLSNQQNVIPQGLTKFSFQFGRLFKERNFLKPKELKIISRTCQTKIIFNMDIYDTTKGLDLDLGRHLQ